MSPFWCLSCASAECTNDAHIQLSVGPGTVLVKGGVASDLFRRTDPTTLRQLFRYAVEYAHTDMLLHLRLLQQETQGAGSEDSLVTSLYAANACHEDGRVVEAARVLEGVADGFYELSMPEKALDTLHLQGIVMMDLQSPRLAIPYLQKVCEARPAEENAIYCLARATLEETAPSTRPEAALAVDGIAFRYNLGSVVDEAIDDYFAVVAEPPAPS